MTQTNLKPQELKSSAMNESNVNEQSMSYIDILRVTQEEEFPLLSEVTSGIIDNPLSLMNAHTDDDGVAVPCALPDAMMQSLPQMMSETLSLYDDADIRTMLLMAMMPTLGSAMSNVRVRHGQRLYSLGMMNICVGPSASGKGSVGDVASLVDGINDIICRESAQAMADHRKRHKRYGRLTSQLTYAAKGDITNLVDVNDIAEEVDEPQAPLRRMHKLPSKTTAANYYRLLYANGDNISYLHIPELAEMTAANRGAFGDFMYILLAAQNEEPLHTARKTDDEDYHIPHTRLALAATGTMSSVREFIPNLEDGLSTRFLYHNLPAKDTVRDEMDEAMAEAVRDVYTYHRSRLTEIDADGAASIAIELISQKEKIVKLEKIHETTINLVDVSFMLPQNISLSAKPHNYYIQAYRINDEEVYVVGVTSTGNADIIKHFGFNPYGIRDIKL